MVTVNMLEACVVENRGSNARDFVMLERNLMSHLRLALLLSLLSSSLLLRSRLVPSGGGDQEPTETTRLPLAGVEFAAAMACICAGAWEYIIGVQDLRTQRPFLSGGRAHLALMAVVAAVIFATCVVLLVEES